MKKSVKILLSISLWFAVIIPLFLSTSCSPVEKETVLDDLLPNLWVFLSHVFAIIVLLLVSIYLVWKPTKTSLVKRHEYIQNEISQAEEIKKNALKQLAEAEQTKINAFNDAKKIIETANDQAYQQKEEIERQALNNSEKIRTQAKYDAEKIKAEVEENMNKQIIDIAFAASNALLKSKVSEKDSETFVSDFINKLDSKELKRGKKE